MGDKNWNKEVKLSVYADNIKVYLEIPRESLRKTSINIKVIQ